MIDERIEAVLAVRWHSADEVAAADHEEVGSLVASVFADPAFAALPIARQFSLVRHVLALYSQSWHRRGRSFVGPIEEVLRRGLVTPYVSLDDLCAIYDALFFLYWYSDVSIDSQRGFGSGTVTPFVQYLADHGVPGPRRTLADRGWGKPLRVGYLAQFGSFGAGNPMTPAAFDFLTGLGDHFPGRYETTLIAWMFHDEPSARRFQEHGVDVIRVDGNSMKERIDAVDDAIRNGAFDVLVSDMNTALPTVIFERRRAPVQVHYQLGMPFWPIRNLDGVFRVWNTAPSRVGLRGEDCFQLNGAWDLKALTPPVDPGEIKALRNDISPQGGLIVGTYGRLIKITPDYLQVVESLVRRHPEVTVAIGGAGDQAMIQAFLAERGLADRIRLFPGYVDGHLWGHVLDVFLDTFPLHGGASCREVIAKGVPVVSMHDEDMPNLSEDERVPALVARTPGEYEAILTRLVEDAAFLDRARVETRTLALSRPGLRDYAATADRALRTLIQRRRRADLTDALTSTAPFRWLRAKGLL